MGRTGTSRLNSASGPNARQLGDFEEPQVTHAGQWLRLAGSPALPKRALGRSSPQTGRCRVRHHRRMQDADITIWLRAWQQGLEGSFERLVPAVYTELRQLAASALRGQQGHATLQPTALVHDALLKVSGAKSLDLNDRKHFFVTMAKVMRQLLIDRARAQSRDKRGGDWQRVDLTQLLPVAIDPRHDLIDLHNALHDLGLADARVASIIELRYFAGLEVDEVAHLLGIDERTVYRDYAFARAWLAQRLA